ncbi:hypothetical protein BKA67DRAFT_540245 [Truncatella angustata]|uniref:Uncharacterized protein n=1 Tax=Truncatella angustata TaxID=152316 RepID=A0A9P8RM32_9PEZI|nr:uncharacterized protein BKA67DRAFT_540245 [Truncatella angustata]KAH6646753.1 hypothetical protein BKA67DRAFT_540245 [Truncatella angustata]
MILRDTNITSEDVRMLLGQIEERGLGSLENVVRATFIGDPDMTTWQSSEIIFMAMKMPRRISIDLESAEDLFNVVVNLQEKSANDLKRSCSATCSITLSSHFGKVKIAYKDFTSAAVTGSATSGSALEDGE